MVRIRLYSFTCLLFISLGASAQDTTTTRPLKAKLNETYEVICKLDDGKSLIPKITRTINIKDLGAVGDGKTDDGPAFAKAMKIIAANKGNVRLLLEPRKTYRILSTATVSPEGKLINGGRAKGGGNTCVIMVEDVENVIIDGQGSEMVLTWPVHFIRVAKSQNVWIGNLTMTYDPLPCAQTRIVAKQPQLKAIDVKLEEGYSLPNFDPSEQTDNHGKWAFSWGIDPNCHFWTKHIKEIDTESTMKGVFRIFPQKRAESSIGGLRVGQRMLVPTLRNGARTSGTHSGIHGSSDVVLYNIVAHAANHFSYHVAGNQGLVVFKKCDIRPQTPEGAEEPSVFSSWRDGFHTKQNRGPIVFDGCTFSGLYDDDINISHITLAMEKIIDKVTYRIRVLIGEGFPEIRIGDTVEAWNYRTGRFCGMSRIVAVQRGDSPGTEDGREYWNQIITVDRPLRNIEGGESGRTLHRDGRDAKVLLTIREYGNWAIVRNCHFHGTVRFRSPGIYANNTFKGWMWVTERKRHVIEAPLPRHQMFRNNVFGPARGEAGRISYEPLVNKDLPLEKIDILGRDISYISNTMHRQLIFQNAQDITLIGNTFITRDGVPPVLIENCKGVKIGPGMIDGQERRSEEMVDGLAVSNTPDTEITAISSENH